MPFCPQKSSKPSGFLGIHVNLQVTALGIGAVYSGVLGDQHLNMSQSSFSMGVLPMVRWK